MFKVSIRKRAIKALEAIPDPYYSNLKNAILLLAKNPRPVGHIKLKGREAYRIIYQILDKILVVEIIDIGHRKNIYE